MRESVWRRSIGRIGEGGHRAEKLLFFREPFLTPALCTIIPRGRCIFLLASAPRPRYCDVGWGMYRFEHVTRRRRVAVATGHEPEPSRFVFFNSSPRRTENGAGRFEMRFEQIIAAVTRGLNWEGIRAIMGVDGLVRAADLRLCMACVSPGTRGCSAAAQAIALQHLAAGYAGPPSPIRWQPSTAGAASSKRLRFSLAGRLPGRTSTCLATLLSKGHQAIG